MRAVVQRVSAARVIVAGRATGEISQGLLVLVGVGRGDDASDVAYLADKVAGLRVFEDSAGKMSLALADIGGAVLAISQFTLYGDVRRGRRPSFDDAAPPAEAVRLYEAFTKRLRDKGLRVETGVFRAMMEVESVNSGPVTILIDSRKSF